MNVSPAQIIAAYLIAEDGAGDGSKDPQPDWSVFVGTLPNDPDGALAVYNEVGIDQGRTLDDGKRVEFPGVMIRVRAGDYGVGFSKAVDVANQLDAAKWSAVSVDDQQFILYSVKRLNNVSDIGFDSSGRRRSLFTFSATVSIGQVT